MCTHCMLRFNRKLGGTHCITALPNFPPTVAIAMHTGAECLTRTDDLPLTVPLRLSPPVVCGLDYPLALADALGSPRLVSTPSCLRKLGSGLA